MNRSLLHKIILDGFLKICLYFHKTPMNFLKVTHNRNKKCHLILGTVQAVY